MAPVATQVTKDESNDETNDETSDEATIREEAPRDFSAREALLDLSFGPERRRKTSERLREGRLPAEGLAFAAEGGGGLRGTLRFWAVRADDRDALLLGPIAVDPGFRRRGLGARMIRHGLLRAREFGHVAVLLVGDAPYYRRFGFSRACAGHLDMPGPVELERFLALELRPGALAGARGVIRAAGDLAETPRWLCAA